MSTLELQSADHAGGRTESPESHFELIRDRPVTDEIRRIVSGQLNPAIEALSAVDDPSDEAIHDARKRLKKCRATLRLVRSAMGEDAYGLENATLRDASRLIAGPRDSFVLLQSFDAVAPGPYSDRGLGTVREELQRRYQHQRERMSRGSDLREVAAVCLGVGARSATWDLGQDDFTTLLQGLRRTYRRGQGEMLTAFSDPSTDNFHQWRKRAKYLRHHAEILRGLGPPTQTLAAECEQLSDLLGDEHDLALLAEVLVELATAESSIAIAATIESRRQSLRVTAAAVGGRVYVESPARFGQRMDGYWQTWQRPVAFLEIKPAPVSRPGLLARLGAFFSRFRQR